MAKYVGKRIVPKLCGAWNDHTKYEMLSVVLDENTGDSYVARKEVPAGTGLNQTEYWALSSRYSQQIQNFSNQLAETLRAVKSDNDATEAAIKADNTTTRSYVDEVTGNALSSMNQAKQSFDSASNELTVRMDSIAGAATTDTEILDARVDIANITHDNLGNHIRKVTSGLDDRLTHLYGITVGYCSPYFQWEPGSIASPSNKDKTRIRTVGYRKSVGTVTIRPDEGYRMAIKLYEQTEEGYVEIYDSAWKKAQFTVPESAGVFYRVALIYEDDSIEIPVSESVHAHIMEEVKLEDGETDLSTRIQSLEISEMEFYSTMDRLNDLSDSLLGFEEVEITWIQGSHVAFKNQTLYRIKNEGILKAKGTLHISVEPGYFGAVILWEINESGGYVAVYNSSWVAGNFVVPDSAGKLYTVCLCSSTAETEEIDPSAGFNLTVTDVTNEESYLKKLQAADKSLDEKIDAVKASFGSIGEKDTKLSLTVRAIAHRGDDLVAPQCTAPAYIMARKRGFTITENDLFHSKDGQFVMWHDPTLGRLGSLRDINGYAMYTNGEDYFWYDGESVFGYSDGYTKVETDVSTLTEVKGADLSVTDLNYDVLRRIDFGYWYDPKFAGTRILTFEEWVLLCKQLGMEIYVDRKFTYTDEEAAELIRIVRKYGMLDHTSWITGPYLAKVIRKYDPNARCGILANPTEGYIEAWGDLATTGRGVFFDGKSTDLTSEAAELALENGIDLGCYYVDFGKVPAETVYEEIRRLVSIGVTEITIDHYRVDDAYQYLLDQYE